MVGGESHRGVALLTALLVVALVTIIAVGMISRQQLDLRRTANLLHSEQAWIYHLAVESHAAPLIARYWDQIEFVSLEQYRELTALTGLGYQEEVDGGAIAVELVLDLEAGFNPNALLNQANSVTERVTESATGERESVGESATPGGVDQLQMQILQRLLGYLQVDEAVADSMLDWVDPDDIPGFAGAEDNYYLTLDPPYRAANAAMRHESELRLLRGVDSDSYQRLLTLFRPLPGGSKINVNWAGAELLMALHEEIGMAEAQAIIEQRQMGGFQSVDAFTSFVKGLTSAAGVAREIPARLISVSPAHFAVRTTVELDGMQHRFQSLLKRDEKGAIGVLLRERLG
ncbi:MAG: type II secretion system minor pseudopilin GspK [Gammaproteobacteria bacterium]|nr:type II secretion system minor pseudopilin GspK [Gammaproteobacteria bacterium]